MAVGENRDSSEERVKRYYTKLTKLEEQRRDWEYTFREVTDYILPDSGFYVLRGDKPNQGETRTDKIFNAVATRSIRVLAAGMQGGLTSPARPWFKLGLEDKDAEQGKAVKLWLSDSEKVLYRLFNRSNFYQCSHQVYLEQAAFGSSCLFCEEDIDTVVNFAVWDPGMYCIQEGARGRVDTVYRRFFMTAAQLVERFGSEVVSRGVTEAIEKNNPFEYFPVMLAIEPKEQWDIDTHVSDKQYRIVYIELSGRAEKGVGILETGYFNEFPCMVPRWIKTGNDVYGRSVGHDELPNVKSLQELEKSYIVGVHKTVNPPMKAPAALKGAMRLYPGGVTYYGGGVGGDIEPMFHAGLNLGFMDRKVSALEQAIKEGFFNDLFISLLNKPNMTATEVMERHEEKMLLLGPVLERQFTDFLDPLIDRVWGVAVRDRLIPEPPPEIEDMDVNIEYISLLAQGQKLSGAQSVEKIVGFATALAEVNPEVLDKVDFDQAVDEMAEMYGSPVAMIRSDEEVVDIRAKREQVLAQQRQQEAMLAQASNVKDLAGAARTMSETDVSKDSALKQILGAGQ